MSSDIERKYSPDWRRKVYGGIVVDIAEDSLDRTTRLLAGIHRGWQNAVGGALARAAASGKTAVKGAVTKEYTISQGEFLRRTRNINHFTRKADGAVSVEFGYAGYVIPLTRFLTRVDSNGRVTTQVQRNGGTEVLDRAFAAQMRSHYGIYERVGVNRFPVRELFGPSTPQMMYSNETVLDTMEEKMAETYEKRIDHEILRILNGWGV